MLIVYVWVQNQTLIWSDACQQDFFSVKDLNLNVEEA